MVRTRNPKPDLPDLIVVGVDEKGLADHAVRLGLDLGRRLGARVDLVHAVAPLLELWSEVYPLRSSGFIPGQLERAWNKIHARLRPILEPAGRGRTVAQAGPDRARAASRRRHAVRVLPGTPAGVVLDAARGKKTAWILLGRHDQRGWLEFGSTLRAVFARSTVPVWIQARRAEPIRRILVPVDLSEESLSALATARALAKVFGASVRVVHCFHLSPISLAGIGASTLSSAAPMLAEARRAEKTAFDRTMARFPWGGVRHTGSFLDGEPGARILQASRDADLVVLGSHGRTGLSSVLLGGTAYAVLKRSKKPVLIVRTPGRKYLVD